MSSSRVLAFLAILSASFAYAAPIEDQFPVNDGWGRLSVQARAPIPFEVENETQARALSREAAVVLAQTSLLKYVLTLKTKSKKTLAEAEIPSLELQQSIRGVVQNARVTKTQWTKKECIVTLVIDKDQLKPLLRRN